jgi:hypothetical protein
MADGMHFAGNDPAIVNAYTAARSARFEYGEAPDHGQ